MVASDSDLVAELLARQFVVEADGAIARPGRTA